VLTGAGLNAILPGLRAATVAQLGNGTDLSIRGVEFSDDRQQGIRRYLLADTVSPYSINVSAGIQRELASNLSYRRTS